MPIEPLDGIDSLAGVSVEIFTMTGRPITTQDQMAIRRALSGMDINVYFRLELKPPIIVVESPPSKTRVMGLLQGAVPDLTFTRRD